MAKPFVYGLSLVLSLLLLPSSVDAAPAATPAKKQPAKTATASKATKKSAKSKSSQLHPVEAKIVEQTNAQRARHGLHPLIVDVSLVRSARNHAAWMTNTRNMQHTTAPVAENIAMGQRTTGEAINSWMNSPGHRANILNRGYRRIGVAAYVTPQGTCYWCQQFKH